MEYLFFSILIGVCCISIVAARMRAYKNKCESHVKAMSTDELKYQANALHDQLEENYSFRKTCMYEAIWKELRERLNS